ncbi:MAG: hypothetical protein F6J98_13960 [Moorea sp. SIO4G2]|uniref:hypothetical protein n=1 Tax=unclassified Moorena TaxID=2683338 RepID=UPI0013FA39CE|nr:MULTISPECIES: hypothetical protein [unclassified Moorena]NEO14837.1 hypothetical protein [Moorena sp. SIO3E8]NEO61477.1 hypothetical protein [Moorena sp. SIO4G2]NEQ01268.1 hypothetical protein [Moorena sp. SIO3F7]
MQKCFSNSVCVNSCPLFPVPCSLFPTSARSLLIAVEVKVKTRFYSRFPIPYFRLPTSDSRLPTPDSRLPTPDLISINP